MFTFLKDTKTLQKYTQISIYPLLILSISYLTIAISAQVAIEE